MSLPPTGSFRRGGRTCDASLFFSDYGIVFPRHRGWPPSTLEALFAPGFLQGSRYWLRKHRIDMPVDSQGPFDYFVSVIGLENP